MCVRVRAGDGFARGSGSVWEGVIVHSRSGVLLAVAYFGWGWAIWRALLWIFHAHIRKCADNISS